MPRLAFRPLALIAIMGFIAAVVGAQAPTPRPLDEDTARVVVNLLELGHMAKPRIDDETATKWCKNFIKDLDPQKVYFETIAPFAEDLAPSIDAFLKCVRTRLALVALGKLDRATSFPLGELTPGMLAVVELTPRNAPFYQECLEPLERLGRHLR